MKRLVARLLTVDPPVKVHETRDCLRFEADIDSISKSEVVVTEQGRKIAIIDCKALEDIGISTDGSLNRAKTLLLRSVCARLNCYATRGDLVHQLARLGFTLEHEKSSTFTKKVELFDASS